MLETFILLDTGMPGLAVSISCPWLGTALGRSIIVLLEKDKMNRVKRGKSILVTKDISDMQEYSLLILDRALLRILEYFRCCLLYMLSRKLLKRGGCVSFFALAVV